jgi:hypothetical protein
MVVYTTSAVSEIPEFQMTSLIMGHVAHGKMEMYTKFWLAILKGRDHLET